MPVKQRSKLLAAAIGIFGVLFLIVAALHLPQVQNYALRRLSGFLESSQGITLTADAMHYNLFALSAELDSLALGSAASVNRPPFLTADSVRAEVSFLSLLKRKPVIESARLEGVEVQIIVDSEGKDNLPEGTNPAYGKESGGSFLPLPFLIEKLSIREGSLRYSNHQSSIEIHLPLWTIEMEGDVSEWSQSMRFRAEKPGRVDYSDEALPVGSLGLDAELKPSMLRLTKLELSAGNSQLNLAGTINGFEHPEIESNAVAGLSMEELAEFFGYDQKAGGQVEIRASASGSYSTMFISSEVSGNDLIFKDLKGVDVSIGGSWDRNANRIRVRSLNIDSPYGSVSGHGGLDLSNNSRQSSATIRFKKLDLEPVTRMLLPIGIASRIHGNLEAKWSGTEFEHAEANADLLISATRRRPVHDVLPVTAAVTAVTHGNNTAFNIDSGKVLGVNLNGKVVLAAGRSIEGTFHADTDRMEPFIDGLEAFLGREQGSLVGTELDGPLVVNAELGGALGALQVDATADAPLTDIAGLSGVNINAHVRYSPERLIFDRVGAVWKGQALTASGEIGLGEEAAELDIKAGVENGSLDAVAAGLGRNIPVEGSFNLAVTLGGAIDDIDLSASLSISELAAYGQRLGALEMQAHIADRRIELRKFELVQPKPGEEPGRLAAAGSYSRKTGKYSFKASAAGLRLNDMTLPAGLAVPGEMNLTASGEGALDSPFMKAELDLGDLKIGSRRLGELHLTAQVDPQLAEIDTRLPRFNFVSKAGVGMQHPYPAQIEAEVDADLSRLDVRLPEDEVLKGGITAAIQASGSLVRWREASARLLIADFLASIQGRDIRNPDPIDLSYRNRRIICDSFSLAMGDSTISASGSLPLDRGVPSGSLDFSGLLNLSDLIGFMPGHQDFSAGGTARVDGTLSGSLKEVDPAVKLALADGSFHHSSFRSRIESIHLDAAYRKGIAEIHSFSAAIGPGEIRAEGEIPVALLFNGSSPGRNGATEPARFSADVQDLHLSDIRLLPEAVTGIVGFHLEGETPDPKDLGSLRVKADFNRFQLKTSEYEVRQADPVQLTIADGKLRIERFLLSAPAARLNAKGAVDLIGDKRIDVSIDGDVNIGIAAVFVDGFRAEGDSHFELKLAGSLPAPEVSGFFEMKDGEFALPTPPVSASALDVMLRIKGESVDIETFSGSLNGGDLNIAGTAAYSASGIRDAKIDISLKNGFFNYPDGMRTRISSDLFLHSYGDFLFLGGATHVLEGSYREQLDVAGELMNYFQSRKSTEFAGDENPFLSRLRFNVAIDTRSPLLIDNNLAELTVNADLRLTGSYYRPGLIGTVTLDEGGKLYFSERDYLIERGTVSFFNQAKIVPELDILAVTEASGYDISLNLSGTPEDFKAELTSDPSLSKADIIAVLLMGRRLEDLQGSGLNVAREQVESYLSGRMTGLLSHKAEEAVGLSLVRIDPSLISPEANPGARLTIGDDITSSLFLIYSMNLMDAGDRIVTVQYDVARNFETEAIRQSDNSYRLSVGQELQFGGAATKSGGGDIREEKIGAVEISGNAVIENEVIHDKLDMATGEEFDFFKLQEGLDRLHRFYRGRKYLEHRIQLERKKGSSPNIVGRKTLFSL